MVPRYGIAYRVTATGTVNITTVNAMIHGVLFNGTGTGIAQIFAGATSTGASALLGRIVAYATVTGNTANGSIYFPFPSDAIGGITVVTEGSADPRLTLFWSPTSAGA